MLFLGKDTTRSLGVACCSWECKLMFRVIGFATCNKYLVVLICSQIHSTIIITYLSSLDGLTCKFQSFFFGQQANGENANTIETGGGGLTGILHDMVLVRRRFRARVLRLLSVVLC